MNKKTLALPSFSAHQAFPVSLEISLPPFFSLSLNLENSSAQQVGLQNTPILIKFWLKYSQILFLHSHCASRTVTVHLPFFRFALFLDWTWATSWARVARYQLLLITFFLFLWSLFFACYIIVKSEWNPIARPYNRVFIQISENFIDMWHVGKAICAVLTKIV